MVKKKELGVTTCTNKLPSFSVACLALVWDANYTTSISSYILTFRSLSLLGDKLFLSIFLKYIYVEKILIKIKK